MNSQPKVGDKVRILKKTEGHPVTDTPYRPGYIDFVVEVDQECELVSLERHPEWVFRPGDLVVMKEQ